NKNAIIGIVDMMPADPYIFFKKFEKDGKLFLAMYSNEKYKNKKDEREFLSYPFTDFLVKYLEDFTFNKKYYGIVINAGSKAEFVLTNEDFVEFVDETMIEKVNLIMERSKDIVI
ncbi:MAG: hypothetical protein ACI4R8_03185, partial [Candidatus Caccovivens sp.]